MTGKEVDRNLVDEGSFVFRGEGDVCWIRGKGDRETWLDWNLLHRKSLCNAFSPPPVRHLS